MGTRERWGVLGRVLLFLVVCAVLLVVAGPVCAKAPGMWSQVALGLVTSLGTYGLTRLFLRWDRLQPEDVGVAATRWSLPRMLGGFLLGLLLVAAQTFLVRVAGHVLWVRGAGFSPAQGVVALLAYGALAAREELAFRGYPLRRLQDSFGMWTAQAAVAVVFLLEHVAGGYSWKNAVLGVFVGSLLFGMTAIATRGLAVPIGIHAAWNFGQWVLGEKEMQGIWRPVVAQGYQSAVDTNGILSYLIVFGAAMLGFWWYKRGQEKSGGVPRGRWESV